MRGRPETRGQLIVVISETARFSKTEVNQGDRIQLLQG